MTRLERPHRHGSSELVLRICSALVLAPLAVVTAYYGRWPFAAFWGAAAVGTFIEWASLMANGRSRSVVAAGSAAIALATILIAAGRGAGALPVLVAGAIGVAVVAPAGRRVWIAGGVAYAGAVAAAAVVLRSDPQYGFAAIIFLFAIVWGTDTAAYFGGRLIGGAKLAARLSPHKTWAGALAGLLAATVAGLIVAQLARLPGLAAIAVLAAILSICAQGGDLWESVLKRRFGAKDSGRLIPGHGGLMDRLDGFVAAGVVAMLIGIARGGLEAPGRGLLAW